jgi:pimeloyl-ACP methyl ester carboxylesterase
VIGLHLLFPSIARLGWLTTTVANPQPEEARGIAFLLRGQAAVFSRSFGILCDRLRNAGVRAEDCRCTGDRWACQHVRAERIAGRTAQPIIFIGHSRGGRRALVAASRLAESGVAVDLLICVDVAFAPPVPANVRTAIHLYRSRRRLYPARPLVRADGSETVIENIDLDAPDSPVSPIGLHHLNITAAQPVGDWIVDRIIREVAPRDSRIISPERSGIM